METALDALIAVLWVSLVSLALGLA